MVLDPDVARRASFLPLVRMRSGERAFGAPELLVDILKSALLPGAAAKGYRATPRDAAEFGLDWMAGGMGVNALGKGAPRGAVLGANVWQGGPHKYGPKGAAESLQHVGKGEGATAYGWGRYDAGSREVGEIYRDTLSRGMVEGVDAKKYGIPNDAAEQIARGWLNYQKANPDELPLFIDESPSGQIIKDIVDGKIRESAGHLYKHDLPDEDIARYLDWDKPLGEQPENVKRAIKDYQDLMGFSDAQLASEIINKTGKLGGYVSSDPLGDIRGKDIMALWYKTEGSKEAASKTARFLGIPGLKYLDGMSRDVGDGTYNYVTWDQDVLDRMKLLERNGVTLE